MAFIITRRLQDGWELVVLEDDRSGSYVEIIPEAGAILNGFGMITAAGKTLNIIDGYKGMTDFRANMHKGFKSAKLSPFVCRLKNGAYSWEGKTYQVEKFMLHEDAMHGILYDAPFRVVSTAAYEEDCHVELSFDYRGDVSGYPFPYSCGIRYKLSEGNMLTISTTIKNPETSLAAIPMTDGWHPYFRLGGKVDDWWLQIAAEQMLEYDESLIPTGKLVGNTDFLEGRIIGDTKLDNGFLLFDHAATISVLKHPGKNISVELISGKNYPYLQVYIPEHRESIAIENLSSAPDAFNNGMGLIQLKAGEEISFEVTIRISAEF
jgi:aldose 1-epimerase